MTRRALLSLPFVAPLAKAVEPYAPLVLRNNVPIQAFNASGMNYWQTSVGGASWGISRGPLSREMGELMIERLRKMREPENW